MSDFKSLLSVFQDATGSSSSTSSAAAKSSNNTRNNISGARKNNSDNGDGLKKDNNNNHHVVDTVADLESTTDPNFSASLMKQRIERLLSIQQIRKSASVNNIGRSSVNGKSIISAAANTENASQATTSSSFHLAVCATIVEEFPHEELWKRWMTSTTIDIPNNVYNSNSNSNNAEQTTKSISCSAELYIHAKHAKQILNNNSNSSSSSYLKSKLLPFSHTPNWNDVRVIRAMLSLLQRALEDVNTTHVLFCTESCIPIVTLGEAARSILLDEVCLWEEKKNDDSGHDGGTAAAAVNVGMQNNDHSSQTKQQQKQRPNWNRSYIHCYNQNSPQCTRFDEHNCWSILSNSIPPSAIHKALPGWCLLSRKHAQSILELSEKHLDGMNLWPAFEKVWAPEEVYFPTALALCGYMEEEVSKRSMTHSEWDTRASNHQDRAHPLTYDDRFDNELVKRVRNENGALFMRKLKKKLDLNVWEEIVVRRGKGCSSSSSSSRADGPHKRAAPSSTSSTNARSGGNDYYNRDRNRGRSDYRGRNTDSRYHYDSRRNQYYGTSNTSHDRDADIRRSYDHGHSSKRQRWR